MKDKKIKFYKSPLGKNISIGIINDYGYGWMITIDLKELKDFLGDEYTLDKEFINMR